MYVLDLSGRRKYKYLSVILAIFIITAFALFFLSAKGNYWVSQVTGNVRLVPIYAVDREDKCVAISFDATWGAEHTSAILDIMDKYKIKTTFFLVNIWLEEFPEMAKTIAEKGHEIGLHSTTHPHFSALSEAEIEKELLANFQMIKEITGYEASLFRPPFGDYNNTSLAKVESLGFRAIQWSVDSLDWKNLSASEIEERVLSRVKSGDIVLFHNNGTNTAEAVDHIIAALQEKGYTIVFVGELLLDGNTYTDFNGVQKLLE